MTFKDLLSQYRFDEIALAFKALWQFNAPEQAARFDLVKWGKLYQNIQSLAVKSSGYYVYLGARWENCSPMIDMNCAVFDKTDNRLCGPVATHHSWPEILGMEIHMEDDVKITPQELTAGLFWEITYYGGTEEMSRKNQERMFDK